MKVNSKKKQEMQIELLNRKLTLVQNDQIEKINIVSEKILSKTSSS